MSLPRENGEILILDSVPDRPHDRRVLPINDDTIKWLLAKYIQGQLATKVLKDILIDLILQHSLGQLSVTTLYAIEDALDVMDLKEQHLGESDDNAAERVATRSRPVSPGVFGTSPFPMFTLARVPRGDVQAPAVDRHPSPSRGLQPAG